MPKQTLLGLRLVFTSVWDTFCIGKTMTCDLCFLGAANFAFFFPHVREHLNTISVMGFKFSTFQFFLCDRTKYGSY